MNTPDILVKGKRILKLAEVVDEVKQLEEWEAVKMSILSFALDRGTEIGRTQQAADFILDCLADLGPVPESLKMQITSEKNISRLFDWGKKAARATSIEEFVKETGLLEK